ncbi:MAG: hypothetical protein J0I79_13215 [Mesorhizobium sp.]|uniref:hypothetical protein n=1 Tax=Mesorhizobium sp. TaxID=1871066 RepID=UPI001AC3F237|nr:hypothetical protein [Mesorhizobium sp.]MBN9218907.1 hypothetical protein [Mesorhizobium sp.]
MTGKVTGVRHTAAALLIAPLWAPVFAAIYAAFFWAPPSFMGTVDRTSWIGLAACAGALFGYGAIVAIGLPAHKALQRLNLRSAAAYLVLWFATGIVAWLIIFVVSFARQGLTFSVSYLAETIIHRTWVPISFGILWALVGATFWAIARPDRRSLPLRPES